MRIGEVNRDNYADYIKLLGGKNTESLDKLLGKDKNGKDIKYDYDPVERAVKSGRSLAGTVVESGSDTSWKEIVPVSDEIKNKLLAVTKEQFLSKSSGKRYGAADGDEIGSIIESHLKTISPSERLSVGWTLEKLVQNEQARLTGIVKANDPTWEQGKPFDRNIFNDNYLNVKV